jgi:hypothetical protein
MSEFVFICESIPVLREDMAHGIIKLGHRAHVSGNKLSEIKKIIRGINGISQSQQSANMGSFKPSVVIFSLSEKSPLGIVDQKRIKSLKSLTAGAPIMAIWPLSYVDPNKTRSFLEEGLITTVFRKQITNYLTVEEVVENVKKFLRK